ncbi:DUF2530 domain-containing protein [Rhodococcus rhodnii]|nr:DUF2530 domain-containing protein [Rhodococcus rhodnii]TXG92256.1 DUF2530 domain-containing protein [Rhodococcus rhodnii]
MPSEPISVPEPAVLRRLSDPRVALVGGVAAWIVTGVVVIATDTQWYGALEACIAGVILGAVGFVLYSIQLRSARAGKRGAQQGLL